MVTADDIYLDMGKQGRPSPVTPRRDRYLDMAAHESGRTSQQDMYLDMAGRTSRASSQYLDMAGRTSRDGLYEDTERSPRPRADVYMEMDDMVQSPERGPYLEGVAMSPEYAMVASPPNGRHLGRRSRSASSVQSATDDQTDVSERAMTPHEVMQMMHPQIFHPTIDENDETVAQQQQQQQQAARAKPTKKGVSIMGGFRKRAKKKKAKAAARQGARIGGGGGGEYLDGAHFGPRDKGVYVDVHGGGGGGRKVAPPSPQYMSALDMAHSPKQIRSWPEQDAAPHPKTNAGPHRRKNGLADAIDSPAPPYVITVG
jgi:hypothetical protein